MKTVTLARKPLIGTVANNVLEHGCGGLNIDASRVGTTDNLNGGAYAENASERHDGAENWRYKRGEQGNAGEYQQPSGRWPANLILQHLDGCRCDGVKTVVNPSGRASGPTKDALGDGVRYGTANGERGEVPFYGGNETVTNWICEPGCPVARLDEQSGKRKTTWVSPTHKNNRDGEFMGALNHPGHQGYNDTGGASRFFKQIGEDK